MSPRRRRTVFSFALVALVTACGSSSSGDGTVGGGDTGTPGADAPVATDSGSARDTAGGGDSLPASDTGTPPGDTTAPPGDGPVADALGDYPAGPYGNTVGATFPPLDWEGYVDDAADAVATTKTFGPYSTDLVRRGGKKYALIHVAETG